MSMRLAMSGHEELVPKEIASCPYCGDPVLCMFSENGNGCRPSHGWRCVCGCERKRFDIDRNHETLKLVSAWAKMLPLRVYGYCDSDGRHHRDNPSERMVCPKCRGVARVDCACDPSKCTCAPWHDGTQWCDWCEDGQMQVRIDRAIGSALDQKYLSILSLLLY